MFRVTNISARTTALLARTEARPCPLVPEIRLRVAPQIVALWQQSADARAGAAPPYWAFPWVGGQALARHLLDHPEEVRGRRVLDVGTGSGLVAIAAARAGAAHVRAVDVDEDAIAAARVNAADNGVAIDVELVDVLAGDTREESVVLVGDLAYEAHLAERAFAFCAAKAERGARVLVGDPGRAHFRLDRFEQVARYDVPTTADLEGRTMRSAGVFTLTVA